MSDIKTKNPDLAELFMPGREDVFSSILNAAKTHAERKGKRDELRAMLQPEVKMAGAGDAAKALIKAVKAAKAESEPAVSRIDMHFKDVTKRIPELTEAARRVKAGELTAADYDALVRQFKPVEPYAFVPQPATTEDAMRALKRKQKEKYGKTHEIPAGTQTGLRLDIPAYQNHGVWINSIHPEGMPTYYGPVSSVRNVTMSGSPEQAFRVATGESAKGPWARIQGEWNPIDEEEAVARAKEYLEHPEWAQIGYDPERHGYFYDRRTMEPVLGAEEVIQIGPLVLGKNPRYGEKAAEKYADGGEVHMAGAGWVRKAAKAIEEAAGKTGSVPVTATKDLTTLQDTHTHLMDDVRSRAMQMQKTMEGFNYKYEPGQYVFFKDSAAKNLPPAKIIRKHLSGNQPMREPVGEGQKPWEGKIMRDPETGKALRTPYEPGYLVRIERGPEDWSEFTVPETGIVGHVEPDEPYAKGGEVHAANGLPLTFPYQDEDPDAYRKWMMEQRFGKVDIPAPYKVTPQEITAARAFQYAPVPQESKARKMLKGLLQAGTEQGKKEVASLQDPNAIPDLINRGLVANNPISGAIDLVNMGLEPFGLGSEMPIGGSAHIQKLMKDYGITKQERPMLETGLALASPFAVPAAQKVGQLAKKAAPAVGEALHGALQSGMESGLIQGPLNVVKPVGGQWLDTGRPLLRPRAFENLRTSDDFAGAAHDRALINWRDKQLANYVRTQMSTPEDPILKLAEEWPAKQRAMLDEKRARLNVLEAKRQAIETGPVPPEVRDPDAWRQARMRTIDGEMSVIREDMDNINEMSPLHVPMQDVYSLSDLAARREAAGFPATGIAQSDFGRMWENLSDRELKSIDAWKLASQEYLPNVSKAERENLDAVMGRGMSGQPPHPMTKTQARDAREFSKDPDFSREVIEQNPWLSKLDPNEQIYGLRNQNQLMRSLGFDHIMDVLRHDLWKGHLKPEELSRLSVADAVKRTARYDAEKAAEMAKAEATSAANLTPHRDFGGGYRMVQLDKPGQFSKESQLMGHSVEGYEPPYNHPDWIEEAAHEGSPSYGHGGWEGIKSGDAQVLSFRDTKNRPHATLEVGKPIVPAGRWWDSLTDQEKIASKESGLKAMQEQGLAVPSGGSSQDAVDSYIASHSPEFAKYLKTQPKKITQIKGKRNGPVNEDYWPYLQRYVRDSGMEVTDDLDKIGMIDAQLANKEQWEYSKKFYNSDLPRYMTESEYRRWLTSGEGFSPDPHFSDPTYGPKGMKRGGLAESDNFAAADTGKVQMMKAPGAKKAEDILSSAAEFIPFVGAGKAASKGEYGSAALQGGLDVLGGSLVKGAGALGAKAIPALAGIFVGPKSKVWDKEAAKQFLKMEKAGAAPEEIWRQTGTFRSPDGILRQEISDAPSRLRRERMNDIEDEYGRIRNMKAADEAKIEDELNRGLITPEEAKRRWEETRGVLLPKIQDIAAEYGRAGKLATPGELRRRAYPTLGQTLYHPEAFDAYPQLKWLRTEYKVDPSVMPEGSLSYKSGETSWTRQDPWKLYARGRTTPEARGVMLHEMQHGIQHMENMGLGGNPAKEWGMLPSQMHPTDYVQQLQRARQAMLDEREALRQQIPPGGFGFSLNPEPNPIIARSTALGGRIRDLEQALREIGGNDMNPVYHRMAGEAEARAVTQRMNMTPEERLAKFPLESYDVPADQLIIRTEPYAKGGKVKRRGGLG